MDLLVCNLAGFVLSEGTTMCHAPMQNGKKVIVTAAMTSPAYRCYAGAHLPITGQEVGLQEVELCI